VAEQGNKDDRARDENQAKPGRERDVAAAWWTVSRSWDSAPSCCRCAGRRV